MSLTADGLHKEAIAALRAQVDVSYDIDPLVATDGDLIGVRVPAIRAIARDLRMRHSEMSLDLSLNLADLAAKGGGREEMLVSFFIIDSFGSELEANHWNRFSRWLESVDNWEVGDQLAKVAGELIARQPSLWSHLGELARSENPWMQRFAVAATATLNHGGRNNTERTFTVLAPVILTTNPMLRKAVCWALREASKADAEATFAFLLEWRDAAPKSVLKQGSSKLPDDLRQVLLAT